jgi:hypothetical protein
LGELRNTKILSKKNSQFWLHVSQLGFAGNWWTIPSLNPCISGFIIWWLIYYATLPQFQHFEEQNNTLLDFFKLFKFSNFFWFFTKSNLFSYISLDFLYGHLLTHWNEHLFILIIHLSFSLD